MIISQSSKCPCSTTCHNRRQVTLDKRSCIQQGIVYRKKSITIKSQLSSEWKFCDVLIHNEHSIK